MTIEHLFDTVFLENTILVVGAALTIITVYLATSVGPVPGGGRKVF